MSLVVTDALVLHVQDYLESSRIYRVLTRDAGVRSALARGARSSRRRFGSAIDLFAQGSVHLHQKPGRDLDTLSAFDVTRARPELGADLARFTGASTIAELTLRFVRGASAEPGLFDTVVLGLDEIAAAPPDRAREATLAVAWRIVSELGFAPSLDACSECHTPLAPDATALFSHPAGGALCDRCGSLAAAGRTLPPGARQALAAWLAGGRVEQLDEPEARAHQRLLREFLREHVLDDRPLRAFEVWEHHGWSAA